MEEAAKVIGGVAGELVFFMPGHYAGIFDAAWLRADYFFSAVYFVSQSFF